MAGHCSNMNRRQIIRGMGAGILGAALGRAAPVIASGVIQGQGKLYTGAASAANVSIVKGSDRRDITLAALKNIEDEVMAAVGNKKRILIKPNFVSTSVQLAATHVDSVRGILDFLRPHFKGRIIVGESSCSRDTTVAGFENFGYRALVKEYGVELLDLNTQPFVYRYVIGKGHKPTPIRIISTFMEDDLFIISAAKMKTHDRVVTTLSLKNVLIASPVRDAKKNDKGLTHCDYPFRKDCLLHYNLFHLAQEVYPDLGVIDGFEAMEGNGPVGGTPVDMRVAMASMDPLALDVVATKMMGFDPAQIMYFNSFAEAGMGCNDLAKIKVIGTPAEQCQRKFKINQKLAEVYDFS